VKEHRILFSDTRTGAGRSGGPIANRLSRVRPLRPGDDVVRRAQRALSRTPDAPTLPGSSGREIRFHSKFEIPAPPMSSGAVDLQPTIRRVKGYDVAGCKLLQ